MKVHGVREMNLAHSGGRCADSGQSERYRVEQRVFVSSQRRDRCTGARDGIGVNFQKR
jgi:hypothetical protein